MSASEPQESGEVRIGHSLNKEEEEFVTKRRRNVQQSLKKLQIQCSENQVPNIALLGSGGGQRAMVGLLGSLDQLQKTGLLDCILYLSGVSGSTWCMASLYQEQNWSTKLETVKDKIIDRLSGPGVSWADAFAKLKNYSEKDIFSLTDVWAAMFVTDYVKEIDEHTLTDNWDQLSKDPFPIYTAIDKQSHKQRKDADSWFEFTPYEAGYSLIGAFVKTSSFGIKFDNGCKIKKQPEMDMLYLQEGNGCKIKKQPEMDMLYLQGLCGSALADTHKILEFISEKIKEFLFEVFEEKRKEDPDCPRIDTCYQVLMDLVDMNLSVLKGIDPSDLDESIRTKLKELSEGKHFHMKKLNLADKEAAKQSMEQYTVNVCNALSHRFSFWPFHILMSSFICTLYWKWGRNYNFLYKMTDERVPSTLQKSKTRDYIDAGLSINSPYFSVLRKERDSDLIISLDFSDGDPFMTVRETAEKCRKLNIPFPEVNVPVDDVKKPKDFYVFKGQNAPTVIHIPLFNEVNCGDKIEDWRNKYATFQLPYKDLQMITDLMDVAGKNITNNVDNLKEQICLAIKKHK